MGIRFLCPNGHKLNVKSFLAGKRAICPDCGAKVVVPNLPEQAANVLASEDAASVDAALSPIQPLADPPSPPETDRGAETFVAMPPTSESPVTVTPSQSREKSPFSEATAVASSPTGEVASPVAMSSEGMYNLRRERYRRKQVRIAVALLILVLLLSGVLIWVLRRNLNSAPASQAAAIISGAMASTLVASDDPLIYRSAATIQGSFDCEY